MTHPDDRDAALLGREFMLADHVEVPKKLRGIRVRVEFESHAGHYVAVKCGTQDFVLVHPDWFVDADSGDVATRPRQPPTLVDRFFHFADWLFDTKAGRRVFWIGLIAILGLMLLSVAYGLQVRHMPVQPLTASCTPVSPRSWCWLWSCWSPC